MMELHRRKLPADLCTPRQFALLVVALVVITGSAAPARAAAGDKLHNSTNLGTKYGTWGATYTCATCHIGNSRSIKLTNYSVATPTGKRAVTFTRMTASVTTATGTMGNDQRTTLNTSNHICEVCHHKTRYHQYSSVAKGAGFKSISSVFHNNRKDCIGCHSHSVGFKAAGGHAFPYPGATHMSATGATTPATSCSCHDSTNAGSYPVAAATAPNCKACHVLGLVLAGTTTSCYDCHGSATYTNGMPAGNAFPNYSGRHAKHVVGQGLACSVCHSTYGSGSATHGSSNRVAHDRTFVNVTSSTKQFHYTSSGNGTCSNIVCHGGPAQWIGGSTTFDCVSCHSAVLPISNGPLAGGQRRAVAAELKSSGTRNHKSTALGSDATKWDCIVCHMEGDMSTGSPSALHANGVIDFRNPDTGTQIRKVSWTGGAVNTNDPGGRYADTMTNLTTSRFSRDLGVVLESDPQWLRVASIQMNLCLKCHDYNGAANSNAWTKNATGTVIGTSLQPFGNAAASTATLYWVTTTLKTAAGNTTGAVMNVFSQISTGNASYHPVRGRQNNSYTTGARMKTPWGNTTKTQPSITVYGYLVSCFDCHAANGASGAQTGTVIAHGNGTTGTLPALRAPSYVATNNLCAVCHAASYASSSSNHGSGSSFGAGGASDHNSSFPACVNCHGSGGTATIGSRATDAHGANAYAASGAATNANSGRPYGFIRNVPNMANWTPGTCRSSSGCTSSGTYTPGGVY
jgi:predicted CxxxxCH...CXXCH cytochrome family protein